MTRHVVDHPRERNEGTRIREYTRIEREQGVPGLHPRTEELKRRPAETPTSARRTEEFLRRERASDD
jgi:hypothetical protein